MVSYQFPLFSSSLSLQPLVPLPTGHPRQTMLIKRDTLGCGLCGFL